MPNENPAENRRIRRVVCAAVLYPNGAMLVGPRHFDSTMQKQHAAIFHGEEKSAPIQGFIDQHGIFMDRVEALAVAKESGQILRKTFPLDELFSEDIY